MLVRSLTPELAEAYFDARTVIEIRDELFQERRPAQPVLDQSEEEDDGDLTRQRTVAGGR